MNSWFPGVRKERRGGRERRERSRREGHEETSERADCEELNKDRGEKRRGVRKGKGKK